MKNKKKLDDFYYHELLHTCHMISIDIDTHLVGHPVCDKEKKIKKKLKKARDLIYDAYQDIGNKY